MEERSTSERPPREVEDAGRGRERTVAVELSGVTKRFGEFVAVDDLTLDIYEGEFFSLLGPSGCGKTTTLRMIAGFEEPTEGGISVAGDPMRGVPPYRRPVNTVFQSYAIFPHLNVFDNVAFGLRRAGVKGEELRKRVTEACEMVQLSGFERRKPNMLSGGQQQRVALARALVNRPKVLLLDEPLGALDLKLRKEMQLYLKDLQHEVGITFIYVTHDQEEALTMSDRIAVMNEGRVQQVADPPPSTSSRTNRFVADFIGQTNVFSGTVESVSGGPGNACAPRRGRRSRPHGARKVEVGRRGSRRRQAREDQVRERGRQRGHRQDQTDRLPRGQHPVHSRASRRGEAGALPAEHPRGRPSRGRAKQVSVAWDARNCLILGG